MRLVPHACNTQHIIKRRPAAQAGLGLSWPRALRGLVAGECALRVVVESSVSYMSSWRPFWVQGTMLTRSSKVR